MIETAGLPGEKKRVFPPFVLNLQPTFLDVDVGRPILAHGAQLDNMGITRIVPNRPEQVIGYPKIVYKRDIGVLVVHQGVRC